MNDELGGISMISIIIFILTLYPVNNSALKTDIMKLNGFFSKTTECEANRIYQKDDMTCFCNEHGRWPHENCSLVFNTKPLTSCKPNSYIQVGCNICRCSTTGNIDKELCTKHNCIEDQQKKYRRYNTAKNKCELNHWYIISSCRLCLCITKENLLCAAELKPKDVQIGKRNLTDCGSTWLTDINKLLASVNPLRERPKIETDKHVDQADSEIDKSQILLKFKPIEEVVKGNVNIGGKKVNIARNDDKINNVDESSSVEENSDKDVEKRKGIGRNTGNTAIPFENNEENDINDSHELESGKKESDNESNSSKKDSDIASSSSEDTERKDTHDKISNDKKPDINTDEKESEITQNIIEKDSDHSLLKLSLPAMLNKMFDFRLRKSITSLHYANCVPGSTIETNCNICFCLNNGKMLCTETKC